MQANETPEAGKTVPCLRPGCGRALLAASPERARYGQYGRRCARLVKFEAIAALIQDFKPAQIEKARELIADGGLVPTGHAGVFRTVSSDGDVVYLTHAVTCSCPGGLHGRVCYHSLAVRLITAQRPSSRRAA